MRRAINRIIPAERAEVGDGMFVLRALPARGLRAVGPFIMLDHFGPNQLPKGKTSDVPPHPHAGFQTVSYMLNGRGHHKDSQGFEQDILPGGVNWMTAGRGIVHAEQISGDPETGIAEGFQIWVNLPRKDKFTDPGFTGLKPEDLPIVHFAGGKVKVIAGSWGDASSPVSSFSPLFLYHISLDAGAALEINLPENSPAGIYVAIGKSRINQDETHFQKGMMATFEAGEGKILLEAEIESDFIVMGGEPLNEPMASYGPFVMSTTDELQQVFSDYRAGKMGEVAWK